MKKTICEIINEEIFNKTILDEGIQPISVEYDIYLDSNLDVYRFKTNKGYSYDVDFFKDKIYPDKIIIVDTNEYLSTVLNDDIISLVEIGFTPTEVKNNTDQKDFGTINDPYIERTNRNEVIEVLGKVLFLVNEYINKNPTYKIYALGTNTHNNNINVFSMLFEQYFSDKYEKFKVREPKRNYNHYYFINFDILKK